METDKTATGTDQDTPLLTQVRLAWVEALGHDRFDDGDFFFAVGGTSLGALKVAARLSSVLGRKVPVRLVFTSQTVSALAEALAEL